MPYYDQDGYDVRFDWGLDGARRLGPLCDTLVIVDILSFSSSVEIATARGATVLPYGMEDATGYARDNDALLAVKRNSLDGEHPYSLSPASLTSIPSGTRIVMPSPNGSALSFAIGETRAMVIAGCFRNSAALGTFIRRRGGSTAVIAAGERWEDSSELRPCFEDFIGAGAILDAIAPSNPSPEAIAPLVAFQTVRFDVLRLVENCASGRELVELGFRPDVTLAATLNVSAAVPVLHDHEFKDIFA